MYIYRKYVIFKREEGADPENPLGGDWRAIICVL